MKITLPLVSIRHHVCIEYDLKQVQILINDLKAARRAAGWSQHTLAEALGTHAQAIKRLEMGVGSVGTMVAVMEVLDFRLTGLPPGTTLAEQLQAGRKRKSLSLEQAAARSGLSRATISGLERGGGTVASLLRLLPVVAPRARRRAPERSYWERISRSTGIAGSLLKIS